MLAEYPKTFKSWATVYDAGPTLKQHWANQLLLLYIIIIYGCFNVGSTSTTLAQHQDNLRLMSHAFGVSDVVLM